MSDSLIIQQPAGPAQQLVLLFHGVGANAADMEPLGRAIAAEFAQAFVVSVAGGQAADLGSGRQWFSVRGITEENRPERVAQALPGFLSAVRHWQHAAQAGIDATALVGFSQGAIMALEATRSADVPAGRVVAIAGRFASLPDRATRKVTVHLIHGKADPVIPYRYTIAAAGRLISLQGDVTADVLPFVGHEINDEVCALVVERFKSYVPQRCWDEALRAERALVRKPAADQA
jgi:phospholipase/carboxylesterase